MVHAQTRGIAALRAGMALLAWSAFPAWASPAVTLTDANDAAHPVTYSAGPYFVRTAELGCFFDGICDDTQLTISVSPGTTAGKRVVARIDWGQPVFADFDLYVEQGTNSIAASASTTDPEIAMFDAVNGVYNIHVDSYQPFGNTVTTQIYLEPRPDPAPVAPGPAARYQVYPPPADMGQVGGEPSIGTNWKSGATVVGNAGGALLLSGDVMFVKWDDGSSPAGDSWVNRPPLTNIISFDPIMYTDRQTGRTITSQLVSDVVAFSAGCSLSSYTDDDGLTWIPAEGCGPPAGADHQALGGGPHHAPLPNPPAPAYPNAVYYCAQSVGAIIGDATCSRSDDGGLTYGPGVVVYTSECGGLHGHPRVAPDGTVYLPNKACTNGDSLGQGLAVSVDNGLTWTFSVVPGSTAGDADPSVATGINDTGRPAGQSSNSVYLGYCDGDGHAMVAVSHDQAASWANVSDVGALAGIRNCVFPEMIAGDDDRAAMFFLGTTTAGAYQATSFGGVWHAYVATTYDAGATWGIHDATPDDPVQVGCIWMQGGSSNCRNLLDFNDIAIDQQGRPNFVFADGCIAPGCTATSPPAGLGNSPSHKSVDTIGRQSGGKTLFSAYDATIGNRVLPGAPKLLSATRESSGVLVKWAAPDDGGSPLTNYRVYRATAPGQESLLATLAPNKPEFLDLTATAGTAYYYTVSAANVHGTGATYGELPVDGQAGVETACALPGITVLTDPAGPEPTQVPPQPADPESLDVLKLQVAEPWFGPDDHSVIFSMTVADLSSLPPSAKWRVIWNQADTSGTSRQLFVEANTSDAAPPTTLQGNYGYIATGATSQCDPADPGSCPVSAFADVPNNRIVIKLNTAGTLGFGEAGTGAHAFDAQVRRGTLLAGLVAATQTLVGAAGNGATPTIDSTPNPGAANRAVDGNLACKPNAAPIAVLTAAPASGIAPLDVSFSGTDSTDTDGDAIASYTFSFGDGSADETRATPAASHRYLAPGNYAASLRVTDARGKDSPSSGPTVIQVTEDAAPDAFSFATRNGVRTGYFTASDPVTITGLSSSATITVSTADNGQYSINGGAFTNQPGLVGAGDAVRARHRSSADASTATTTTVSIGGVAGTFRSVTGVKDRTPDAFDFNTFVRVPPATLIESNVVTPTGYALAATLAPSPGLEYRLDGGAWTSAPGSIQPGQTLQVRHASAAASKVLARSTINIGGWPAHFVTRTQ